MDERQNKIKSAMNKDKDNKRKDKTVLNTSKEKIRKKMAGNRAGKVFCNIDGQGKSWLKPIWPLRENHEKIKWCGRGSIRM